jgi:CRP-like cAMP-binding protein
MISPEKLKRIAFFSPFKAEHLQQIAMMADEVEIPKGEILFEECQPAEIFYILLEGNVDLYYKTEESYPKKVKKEFEVGEINPGEILTFSALIEPYVLNASGKASKDSTVVKIDAVKLRALFEAEPRLGYQAMQQLTKAIMENLAYTRVQLAAAWA